MCSGFLLEYTFLDVAEYDEQCRGEEQQRKGAYNHTANDAGGQGAATVGAHARGKHQRHQSEDHRQYGHQYGAEAHFGGLACRIYQG